LQFWEIGICGPCLFWLSSYAQNVGANIVLADWILETVVTKTCLLLNQQKASLLLPAAT
jgi:hypothetical protein